LRLILVATFDPLRQAFPNDLLEERYQMF